MKLFEVTDEEKSTYQPEEPQVDVEGETESGFDTETSAEDSDQGVNIPSNIISLCHRVIDGGDAEHPAYNAAHNILGIEQDIKTVEQQAQDM